MAEKDAENSLERHDNTKIRRQTGQRTKEEIVQRQIVYQKTANERDVDLG